MADELGAVLDAPEVVADGAAEQVNEDQQQVTEDKPEPVEQPEVKGDDRVLPQWIRNLKQIDPVAYKEARGNFFGKRTFEEKLKDFDLDGTKQFLEERGGRDAILESLNSLEGKAAEYDGLMQKIAEGNSDVLKDIPQDALVKLAPAVAEQWSQADPEGWGAAMSGVIASTLQQNGIPLFLERLSMNLEFGKTEEVQKMVDQLKGWAGSFSEKAAAPRTQTAKPAVQDPDVKSEREQWETDKFTSTVRSEVDGFREPLIDQQLKSYCDRRPKDVEAHQLAKSNVINQVVARMKADKDYQKSLNGLFVRKDKEGAMRLIKSRETAAINEIAPKVGRVIFGNPEKPKTEDKPKPPRPSTPMTPSAAKANKFDEIWGE